MNIPHPLHLDQLTPRLGEACAPSFERMVLNCKRTFRVPHAAIGLREGRYIQLYFPDSNRQRLLLDDAVCALPLVIPGDQVTIDDLDLLPEDFQPLWSMALGVRSYAGVPIFVRRQLLGSLSIADYQPRHFGQAEVVQLRNMAISLGALLDLHL